MRPHLPGDVVVLVHGLAAQRFVMAALGRAVRKMCGGIVNWGYRSLWSPIERHGRDFAGLLHRLDQRASGRIHLVTHSMGGIIARLALAQFAPRKLGRIVMIAPPNRGSHAATRLAPYLGFVFPPLTQLACHETSFVCSLPPPEVKELGIIAAGSDLLVPEHSTHLDCECDHIVVQGLHTSILWRTETAAQVRHFLQHGRFRRE